MNFICKKFTRLILVAAAVICTVLLLSAGVGASSGDTIRVGLFYGSNALPSANLANEVGSGYQFGYYDSASQFIPLGTTQQEKITMCKDTNLYLSGGSFYETPTASAYRLIGAYHLQPAGEYATYEEAQLAAASYPYGFPAWVGGKYVVRFEFYSTIENAQAAAPQFGDVQVVGASTTCYTVVNTTTGDILFEFDAVGNACFAVQPDITGEPSPQTWFKGYCYEGAFQYNRRNGNDMTVINIVNIDRYVTGVLPYEFVCSGGIESLKAGTVAIRTYAQASSKHRSLDFDVCTTTDCQVYRGVYTGNYAASVQEAAMATAGQCLYYDGKYIDALFYAANGGATESAENTWGYAYPYLIAQEDPYEDSIDFSSKVWSYTVTPAQVQTMLQKAGYACGEIVSMEVTQLTQAGNVNRIVITDANGKTLSFSKDNVRILQNIPGIAYFSRRFEIEPIYGASAPSVDTPTTGSVFVFDGSTTTEQDTVHAITANGTVQLSGPFSVLTDAGNVSSQSSTASTQGDVQGWTIRGRGFGHNVGLSQWGAYAMAAQGFTYDRILQFYYPGTTLE